MSDSILSERAAGILLAVSSLPSPYGIGTFGEDAREWLRFLKSAGQRYWQILPLGPTGWGDSPYQSFSAFAISPYYIDLDELVARGLLAQEEIDSVRWARRGVAVDYAALYRHREPLLRAACERFRSRGGSPVKALEEFRAKNAFWLDDFALFMALKKMHKGRAWLEWDDGLRARDAQALEKARKSLADDIFFYSFTQFIALAQWKELREYAHELGVAIIGDAPIYVAADSADAWANDELFQLDENFKPSRVAGCPPDPFSADGQLWGNPLYRWDRAEETGFAWWIARLRACFELYDVTRIDHFRGFESYYSIDARSSSARDGEWVKGPGLAFVEALRRELPGAAIIAEDLGYLTPEVKALLKASGYPGMKVLQFAFDSREPSDYIPYAYERNCVVYTGTHDNPTALGWFKSAPAEDAAFAFAFLGSAFAAEGARALVRCALASVANTAIIPMQDYLGLDDRARMNTPSTIGGDNWRWRLLPGIAGDELARGIGRMAEVYGRHAFAKKQAVKA